MCVHTIAWMCVHDFVFAPHSSSSRLSVLPRQGVSLLLAADCTLLSVAYGYISTRLRLAVLQLPFTLVYIAACVQRPPTPTPRDALPSFVPSCTVLLSSPPHPNPRL